MIVTNLVCKHLLFMLNDVLGLDHFAKRIQHKTSDKSSVALSSST